jgi:diaminobutyrate-2-oxoglutarate transaminase
VGSGELAEKICARCFEKGLIIETSGPDDEVVKVLAPLTTPHETLEAGLAIVAESVDEIVSTENLAAE